MNTTINFNSDDMNLNNLFFLNSHLTPRRTQSRIKMHVNMTSKEVIETFRRVMDAPHESHIDSDNDLNMYIDNPEVGAVQLDVIKDTAIGTCVFQGIIVALPGTIAAIHNAFGEYRWIEESESGVYRITIDHSYLNDNGSTQSIRHHRKTTSFESLREDMYPQIDVPAMMESYRNGTANILALTGVPGTGKTCMAKLCMREFAKLNRRETSVSYVKDWEILASDSFWATLARTAPDILILDDLDDELLPRTEGTNPIVNHLLSFSDGIFDVPTKIIITTNQPNSRIDPALVRPGRCFNVLSLPHLTRAQAHKAWNAMGSDSTGFRTMFPDDETISQALLVSEFQQYTMNDKPSYLRDPSISIRRRLQAGGVANTSEE